MKQVDPVPELIRLAKVQCNEIEVLRERLREAEDACYALHEALHRDVREHGGTAEDRRDIDRAIPWDFDALRRARRRKES